MDVKTNKIHGKKERVITGITLRPYGSVIYLVTLDVNETQHYSFELSRERDIVLATS